MILGMVILRMRPLAIGKGFWYPINQRDFENTTWGRFGQRGNYHNFRGQDDVDGDLDVIKQKIPTFLGKNNPEEKGGLNL